ncbi:MULTISPECIES: glutamate--tRNA ligase [unclassified Leucobacter]|uniref:glutamate--tRNA ligase n=1 Tax=unclassified Leucobacter TaxID=2621730 RepID=UPI00165DB15E|nr:MULTISPECIES: glutamate--tRNA ligase [unclassified Leucobacter]MBC9926331.1 glutamate--tRNA ligase [Leucobacter sp. cx-169]MBC9936881.1 glutamate--tRNA ligase [Leucobacter sp. cx-87]
MSHVATPQFSSATGADVRVRFCPSPTGTPHVGMVRTALFNWAYARHTGGTFVFRIEDTDAARDSEESYGQIIDSMRWLGLNWDEGIDAGGEHGPYRQSQRGEIYQGVIERLREAGYLYESFSTSEEIDARNEANGRAKQLGYDNLDRDLTDEQRAAYRAEGRSPALRFRVPEVDLSFTDLVRGDISFPAGSTIDFVVVRPNGAPLYTLVNPVDDALMGITHVLRGEDLLSSTPRQVALYHALVAIGVAKEIPLFGHLPYVMGEGNKKLSKRDPESNLLHHKNRGFIPEGLINYLSLLGWSLAPDRDVFSTDELIAAFDVKDVNPNPARFDQKKADSINADHIRLLSEADFGERILPYLAAESVIPAEPSAEQLELIRQAVPLVQSRVTVLSDVVGMLAFLFTPTDELEYAEDAMKSLPADARTVLAAGIEALSALSDTDWNTEQIQAALQAALIDGLGLKPRVAFGPLRVAASGRRVSPPLFESFELLGQSETLARLRRLDGRLAE